MVIIFILIVVVVGLIVFYITTYNNLINVREKLENSKGQIAVQIESRWDALSNLIGATKQYSQHEAETLENVIKARNLVSSKSSVGELEQSEQQFQSLVGILE